VLDERLDGSDLEWAHDHLRRCDACRARLTDFTDMALRVERLPMASVTSEAIAEALAWITGRPIDEDAWQIDEEDEPFPAPAMPVAELIAEPEPLLAAVEELPAASAILEDPETSTLFEEPQPAASFDEANPSEAVLDEPDPEPDWFEAHEEAKFFDGPNEAADLAMLAAPSEFPEPPVALPPLTPPASVVQLTSHAPTQPVASHLLSDLEKEIFKDSPWEFTGLPPLSQAQPASPMPATRIAPPPDLGATYPLRSREDKVSGSDTLMRIVVGLGTAGCILLAAFLYEGDWLHLRQQAAVSPAPTATLQPTPTPTVAATPSPIPTPTPVALLPAPVVARLGNGLKGESVIRIRPGTAYSNYTRLVFDMQGAGLPSMVITRPDSLHLVVRFKATTASSQLVVGGIHSAQVARIETPLQVGADLLITIDLARPVRLAPFTLPASGGYHPRLVLDLYRS
jgi:hypothetical protein